MVLSMLHSYQLNVADGAVHASTNAFELSTKDPSLDKLSYNLSSNSGLSSDYYYWQMA